MEQKFQLLVSIGRKIIYQSVLTISAEKMQEHLNEFSNSGLIAELEDAIFDGLRRGNKKITKKVFAKLSSEELVKKFPVIVMTAIIEHYLGDKLITNFPDFISLSKFPGVSEELETCHLDGYRIKCTPLK